MSKTCRHFLYLCILFLISYSTAVCNCIKIYRVSNGFQCCSLNSAILAFPGCKDASCASTCFRPCSGLSAVKLILKTPTWKQFYFRWVYVRTANMEVIFSILLTGCPSQLRCPEFLLPFLMFYKLLWISLCTEPEGITPASYPCLTLPVSVHSTTILYKKRITSLSW